MIDAINFLKLFFYQLKMAWNNMKEILVIQNEDKAKMKLIYGARALFKHFYKLDQGYACWNLCLALL